jgi:hypothetical protein
MGLLRLVLGGGFCAVVKERCVDNSQAIMLGIYLDSVPKSASMQISDE